MKIEIPVWSLITDGGDGGGNTTVYGSLEELKQENFSQDWLSEEENAKAFQSALNGDNPYDDGEIAKGVIVIEEVNGVYKLARPINFHWGQ